MAESITYVYEQFWKSIPDCPISEEFDTPKQVQTLNQLIAPLEQICTSLAGTKVQQYPPKWDEKQESFLICSKDGSASYVYIRISLVEDKPSGTYNTSVTYQHGFENEALLSKLSEFYEGGGTSRQIYPNPYKSKVRH